MTEITTVNNDTLVEGSLSPHIIESQNPALEFNTERNLAEESRNSTRKRGHNASLEEQQPQPHLKLRTEKTGSLLKKSRSEYDDKTTDTEESDPFLGTSNFLYKKMPKGRIVGHQLACIAQQLWEARMVMQESAISSFDLIKESGKRQREQSSADILELEKEHKKIRRFDFTRYASGLLSPLNLLGLQETQGALGIFWGLAAATASSSVGLSPPVALSLLYKQGLPSIAGGVMQLISSQATHKESGPSTWAPYLNWFGKSLQAYGAVNAISNLGSIGNNVLGSTVATALNVLPTVTSAFLNHQTNSVSISMVGEAGQNSLKIRAIREKRSMNQEKQSEELESTIGSIKHKSIIETMKTISSRMEDQQQITVKIQSRQIKA